MGTATVAHSSSAGDPGNGHGFQVAAATGGSVVAVLAPVPWAWTAPLVTPAVRRTADPAATRRWSARRADMRTDLMRLGPPLVAERSAGQAEVVQVQSKQPGIRAKAA